MVEHPYDVCPGCKYISECPHPTVNEIGTPKEPDECLKKGKIKIEQKPYGTKRIDVA